MFDPEVLQILGLNLLAQKSPNFGENLGNAGLATLQYQRQKEEDKLRREEREFLKQQREMQMAQLQRQQRAQQQQEELYQRFVQPERPPVPYNDALGSEPPQPNIPGAPPSFNMEGYMAALPSLGPQGLEQAMRMQQAMGPEFMSVAEGGALVNKRTGQPVFQNAKKEKPKYVPGDTREYKSGGLIYTQEFDGENWKTIAKTPQWKPDAPEKPIAPPPGYQWNADRTGVMPIPGGPADYKVGKEAEATAKRQEGALARAQAVMKTVKEATDNTGYFTAGLGSIGLASVPGTPAYNLRRKLDEVKANIGFQELQAMREASPTGGALGQVAVQELNMLQAVLGSLDANQSPEQLQRSLNKVYDHFSKWERAVKASKQQPTSQPSIDALVEQYGGK